MKLFISSAVLFLSSICAASWDDDFQILKNRARSYEDAGAICEELARIKFEKKYNNSQYEMVVGIAYGDSRKITGELDIVVFDRVESNVKHVAEVKCWKSMSGGLEKAKEQRLRFLTNLRSKRQIYLQSTSTEQSYDINQFKNISAFTTLGQRGAVQNGYDDELEYELRDLHRYSMELIRCQDRGECVRPE